MATVALFLSKEVNELGYSEIFFRLNVTRAKRFRHSTGIFVPANRWSEKNKSLIIPRIETSERTELIELDKEINDFTNHLILCAQNTDVENVSRKWMLQCIDRYKNPDKYVVVNNAGFFAVFNEYIETASFSNARKKGVLVVYRILQRFEYYKQHYDPSFKLSFDAFDKTLLIEIENYVKDEKQHLDIIQPMLNKMDNTRTPTARAHNTVIAKMKIVRAFIKWSLANNYMDKDPFLNYSIKSEVYGTPYYISIDERNQIYHHDFSHEPDLEIQRDIFIFQCLVGVRISDLYLLKKSNVVEGGIEYIAQKTRTELPETIRVPLNEQAQEIVEKYEDHEGDELFPFIPKQYYNYSIKEIFTQVGITRLVTVLNPRTRKQEQVPINEVASSHLARRTFIGNLYKQVKDPSLVGSLSGHKEGSRAFARYRDIDDDIKSDLVDLLL